MREHRVEKRGGYLCYRGQANFATPLHARLFVAKSLRTGFMFTQTRPRTCWGRSLLLSSPPNGSLVAAVFLSFS